MSSDTRTIYDLPVELLRSIARILLAGDLPTVGARGLLLEDSYLALLRGWQQSNSTPTPCAPSAICNSEEAARSGQSTTCFQNDLAPLRSCLDMLAVCRRFRDSILGDSLFWGEALLLSPPLLPAALTQALAIPQPRLEFVAHGGSCLCVLAYVRQNMEAIRRIDLALPSRDQTGQHATSQLIQDELSLGAPILEDIRLRFDWATAGDAPREKTIILLPVIRTSSLLNSSFAVAGDLLTCLCLAAEATAYRWARADIYNLLRLCPSLQILSLQMVLLDYDGLSEPERLAYRESGRITIRDLRYLHISDRPLEWTHFNNHAFIAPKCRKHPDIIVTMRGLPGPLAAQVGNAVHTSGLNGIGRYHRVMAMRLLNDGKVDQWPEYVTLSFGDDHDSAMSFRDHTSHASAGSLTVRNAAFSIEPHRSRPFLRAPADHSSPESLLREFFKACTPLCLRDIQTFIVDASPPYYLITRWEEIIPYLWDVRCIIVYGISSFHSPVLMLLAAAIARTTSEFEDNPRGLPCRKLNSIRVPNAIDRVPQAAISRLHATLQTGRPRGARTPTIAWTL